MNPSSPPPPPRASPSSPHPPSPPLPPTPLPSFQSFPPPVTTSMNPNYRRVCSSARRFFSRCALVAAPSPTTVAANDAASRIVSIAAAVSNVHSDGSPPGGPLGNISNPPRGARGTRRRPTETPRDDAHSIRVVFERARATRAVANDDDDRLASTGAASLARARGATVTARISRETRNGERLASVRVASRPRGDGDRRARGRSHARRRRGRAPPSVERGRERVGTTAGGARERRGG